MMCFIEAFFKLPIYLLQWSWLTAQFGKFSEKFFLFFIQIRGCLDYRFNNLVTAPESLQVVDTFSFQAEHGAALGSPWNLELFCAV